MTKGLSFSLIVGAIPLMLLLFVAGSLIVTPEIVDILEGEFLRFLPDNVRERLLTGVQRYTESPGSLSALAVFFFLLAVNNLFFDIYRTVSVGIGTEWSVGKGRLGALAASAVLLVVLYIAALASTAAEVAGRLYPVPDLLVFLGGRSVSALFAAGAFYAIFRLAAGKPLRTGRTILIALGAAVVWQTIFTLGGTTVRVAGSRFVAYGILAWAIVFLVFMRLMAEILLFSSLLIRETALPEDQSDATVDESAAGERS
jgi:uncharacterized BrkB/YihY/UPF0761 family membrane protein